MGIDTTEVPEAAGTKWNFLKFKPGLVGGHCIGVDPYYLTHKAETLGYHTQVILAGRRPGDIAQCYADASLAQETLGWPAQLGIDSMCADAWRWQRRAAGNLSR